jgi:hypothetical protein
MIYDAAVIIPTTLSRDLGRPLRSVFAQDLDGSVQILIGIDVAKGSRDALEALRRECPPRMEMTIVDLGYSTARQRGGFYNVWSGGAIRTILSYAANSRYLAYLDDDNWWAPPHLSDLLGAVAGVDWAYTYRWYVDPATLEVMCLDEWESMGPERGMYAQDWNGFVDTNCLLIDKRKCHWVLPAWSVPKNRKGAAPERVVLDRLHPGHASRCTEKATAYYVVRDSDVKRIRQLMRKMAAKSTPEEHT